ncbi:two-component system, OmpR family, response regulator VanR [Enterococcus malodoratus]|uniref:response regulator transcription factor n=1 Tax=Enterococcus malodoratus TaxID=71451 RepID=UPI0008D863A2|nr:response regulator transcription factor [Enterococcus malodoratus]SES72182.1 two-component system, OmpR family, response regulator VanR [Enterococcus malodoratus]
MVKILMVEDEQEISELVVFYLKNENYEVITCENGQAALEKIRTEDFALAILDVMLPDISGFELCQAIRKKYTYPIIMLTAKGEEIDKITGLTLGADDYMTKPFRPLELVARVKAQLRRATQYSNLGRNILMVKGIELDVEKRKVFLNEQELYLTPIEFSILKLLMERQDQVVSSEQIFREVWGEKYYVNSNNTIMVHIRHLREKLQDTGEKYKYIQTVWGIGYKI